MTTAHLTTGRKEVGLALGPGRLVAHLAVARASGHAGAWERAIEPVDSSAGQADLSAALAELRETLGVSRAHASVALLPGLVQVKRIQLPRMRDDEIRTVLTRDAARYFFAAREPQVVAFRRLTASRAPIVPLLVAIAPQSIIEALFAAARDSGWQLDRIIPAHAASTSPATPCFTLDDPALAAAMHARDARSLELLPQRVHEARSRRVRTISRALVAAAAACFASGALLDLLGTRRELNQVEARRLAIRTRVEGVLRVRDALGTVDRRIATLATLDRTAPQWSGAMATIATHLPLDAHLVAFRGRSDSLVLEGTAERATGVFEAIQRAPGVSGVRANAPIRQELNGEQRPVEHFAVALRLAQAVTSPETKP